MLISDQELIPLLRSALARGQRINMEVNGRSMFPFIRDGDVVEMVPMPPLPKVGAVVLAQLSEDWYPLHRLVARSNSGWLIRGDNSIKPDGFVKTERLIGLVAKVKRNDRSVCFASGVSGLLTAWFSKNGWLFPITSILYKFNKVSQAFRKRL